MMRAAVTLLTLIVVNMAIVAAFIALGWPVWIAYALAFGAAFALGATPSRDGAAQRTPSARRQ